MLFSVFHGKLDGQMQQNEVLQMQVCGVQSALQLFLAALFWKRDCFVLFLFGLRSTLKSHVKLS